MRYHTNLISVQALVILLHEAIPIICYKIWQPQEVGIISHQSDGELTGQMVNKKVSQEMFDSIIREVVEEIGVPAAALVSIIPFGYMLVESVSIWLNFFPPNEIIGEFANGSFCFHFNSNISTFCITDLLSLLNY